jgi:hypothetical protein
MPQNVVGPFMAGTMVEDAHEVKPVSRGTETGRCCPLRAYPALPDGGESWWMLRRFDIKSTQLTPS